MRGVFVCPECHLRTRPAALFLSGRKTWWSVSPAEASLYGDLCRHREMWRNGVILGCVSMRAAIDPWLRSEPDTQTGQVSIAEIATASYVIEARADISVRSPPVIAESFRDSEIRAGFQCNPGSAEIRSYDLRDVVLDADRMILLRNGRRIVETRYILDDDEYWREPDEPRAMHGIEDDRMVVIGFNIAFKNYYHWLMQCLPAIDSAVRTIGAANCVLALPPLAGWQEETLRMLGHAGIPRIQIDPGSRYHFRRAHYCAYLNGSAAFFLSPRCLNVIDALSAQVEPVAYAPERLYVARLDSRHRIIKNEDEVRRFLEGHGFVTLVPGYYSIRDQIGLFKSARIVMGGHGAGLTNLAFCEAGTIVLELVQSNYPNVCMNRIAQARGLRYHAECFECEVNADVHRQEWVVDMERLETKLRDIL
jgi:hypothetical protein